MLTTIVLDPRFEHAGMTINFKYKGISLLEARMDDDRISLHYVLRIVRCRIASPFPPHWNLYGSLPRIKSNA
jgi:hypothetical protein